MIVIFESLYIFMINLYFSDLVLLLLLLLLLLLTTNILANMDHIKTFSNIQLYKLTKPEVSSTTKTLNMEKSFQLCYVSCNL